MLQLIHTALSQAGVITPQASLVHNVTITTGDCVSIEVRDCGSDSWFHIKASRFIDLGPQFDRYQLARQHFPAFAPEPVIHTRVGEWSIMVSRAIDHRCLIAKDLEGRSTQKRIAQDLVDFFSIARSLPPSIRTSHDSLVELLRDYFSTDPNTRSKIIAFLDSLDPRDLQSIPDIPQHGDFVLNNLGASHGHLVIFDWEDYGELMLGGLDVFMLSWSVAGGNAASADAIAQTDQPGNSPWSFAVPACHATGLAYDIFRKMAPLYLIAFMYLKRNYGREICLRIDSILDNILP